MWKKRSFKRFAVLGEIRVKPFNSRRWTKAVLTTVSRGGVGLYLNGPFKKGERVSIKISYMRNGRLTAVEDICGTVRWVLPLGGYKAAGIKFDNIVEKTEDPLLLRCIEYAKKKGKR